MMRRASSLAGPWEDKRQLKHSDRDAFEPNQGGFVEGPDGRWGEAVFLLTLEEDSEYGVPPFVWLGLSFSGFHPKK